MDTGRLEAFSDGVIAVIITIMVLELKPPQGNGLQSLQPVVPVFLNYVLSFVFVAIYWNNHHHMFAAAKRVDGRVMWTNLHLLFWLSLVPFVTSWMGENHFTPVPTALYGDVLLMSALAYTVLQSAIVASNREDTTLRSAIGNDRKGKASLACYALAISLAFVAPWCSDVLYVVVAIMWFVPDPRIEKRLANE